MKWLVLITVGLLTNVVSANPNENILTDMSLTMSQIMGCETRLENGKYTPCEAHQPPLNTTLYRLDYDNESYVPDAFKTYIKPAVSQQEKEAKISLLILMENDNRQVLGFTTDRAGDDYGMTHRARFELGKQTQDYSLKVAYQTTLYSAPVAGTERNDNVGHARVLTDQNFQNENIYQIIVDNIPQKKVYYWRAEAGFIELSREKGNIFDASMQQDKFHKAVNGAMPGTWGEYTYLEEGSKAKWGGFVGAFLGLQKSIELSRRVTVNLNGDIGGRTANLSGSSYVQAAGEGSLNFRRSKGSVIRVYVGAAARNHSAGTETQILGGVEYKTRGGSALGLAMTKTTGQLMQNSSYNINNVVTGQPDPTWFVYFKKVLN